MAIQFTLANSEYLEIDSNLLNTETFTWAAWCFPDALSFATVLWSGNKDDASEFHTLLQTTSDPAHFRAFSTVGTNRHSTSNTDFAQSTWGHVIGEHASTSSRACYVDGGADTANTNTVTGVNAATNRFSVGRRGDSSPTLYYDGRIAEIGIWSVSLSSASRTQLAAGFSPLLVEPASLLHYWPLKNISDLTDRVGGVTLTAFNTPTTANHPPMLNPVGQRIFVPVTAVVANPKGPLGMPLHGALGGPI